MPKKFVIGISIIVLGIAYFIVSGVSEGTAYYVTVEDLTRNGDNFIGDRLRMGGVVLEGSIEIDIQKLDVNFKIHQDEHVVDVFYNGITPDMFRDGSDVILEGSYTKEGIFQADVLMAKCPSKYESDEYQLKELSEDIKS